jgi:hypothetical protein
LFWVIQTTSGNSRDVRKPFSHRESGKYRPGWAAAKGLQPVINAKSEKLVGIWKGLVRTVATQLQLCHAEAGEKAT